MSIVDDGAAAAETVVVVVVVEKQQVSTLPLVCASRHRDSPVGSPLDGPNSSCWLIIDLAFWLAH